MAETHEDNAPLSAADVFVRQLAEVGVDYFFANGGTDFPPIAEAFARAQYSNAVVPRPIVVAHENLAVAMAHGVYMISRRPQAVMVHVNVGTANTINAILDASRDQTPVLLFAGRTPYSERGRHGSRTRYIHWAQEMFDQAGMLREAVKWDYELHQPEQAAALVSRAYQVAMTAPRGPVYATLPRDVLAEPVPDGAATPVRLAASAAAFPDPLSVRRVGELLMAAKRPLIITAAGGRTREGFDALARFAERFLVPVVSFHPRFLNMSSEHPMNAGASPGPLLADADLVLVIDCDVPWIPAQHSPSPGATVVHIGDDPICHRYPMRSFATDLAIAARADFVLAAIEAEAGELAADARARVAARPAWLQTSKASARAATATPGAGSAITPEWLSACIGAAVGEDAIIVNEYPLRTEHCPRTRFGTYFGLSPAGGLGWGLGAALGAKLAAPEALVVATLGDGAYMFANPTAAHFVAESQGLPILVVIFNNGHYGAVRNSTLAMYDKGFAARERGKLFAELAPAPAYEKLVEASGGMGLRVELAEQLPEALARAAACVTRERRQALLNVVCPY